MGQELFYPPNVGGWNGGRTWLSTRAVLARTNYAAALVAGQITSPVRPPNFAAIAAQNAASNRPEDYIRFVSQLLYGRDCGNTTQTVLDLLTVPGAHLH
jgi:uncharacterized protein (DUF1800 family)